MSRETLHVTDSDVMQAKEGYIRYASGVAIMNNPELTSELHRIEASNSLVIVASAEEIMIEGLKQIIRYSMPHEPRLGIVTLEHRFDEAYPVMREVVDDACTTESERLKALNTFIPVIRPAAVLHEFIYGYICRSRRGKIKAKHLMDSFPISPDLDPEIVNLPYAQVLAQVEERRAA